MKRLILIDSHAIIHRAYHALPPLTSPSGEPTNAVYGFTTMLLRVLRELKPDYIAAAFDLPGPTFRHIAYERYKAQRPETPTDLSSQFAKVREVLNAFGIPVFEKEGFEADDIIGTIAKKLFGQKDTEIVVVTGDLDALQLVRPRLKVYSMKKGITETVIYDEKAVVERYGLKPAQLVDFKGLKGDPSDNIAGVKGIGEKTAAGLIREFGSVEGVYKALKKGTKKVSESIAAKLKEGEKDAKFSKELVTIRANVPVTFRLDELRWKDGGDEKKIREVFQKYGFFSLLKRLEGGKEKVMIQPALISSTEIGEAKIEKLVPENIEKRLGDSAWQDAALIFEGGDLFLIPREGKRVFILDPRLFREARVKKGLEGEKFFVHDGKSIIHLLRAYGIELGKIRFDLMTAAYLTSTVFRDFSFPAIAVRELGRLLAPDVREEFAHFFEIVKSYETKLSSGKLREVLERIELPVARVLADMEDRGILINKDFLGRLAKKIDSELLDLTKKIYKLAGEEFNINSSQQLSRILFEGLKIKTLGLRKTEKGGVISTRESELEKLRETHPIIAEILRYRELMKLKTTYVDALPELINPKTGRVHTTFNQTGTVTGRLSSSDPNLQNIPVLSEVGREIRKAFVAEKGYELVSFDYSQIELRVAAHLADDKKMIEAFKKGLDIHKMTASEIYNIPLEKVTAEQRRAAKTLNFGILYGMGSQALAESTGMSREEAKKFIDEYFQDFSGIRDYIERTKRFAEERGYVETIFGRRRYIPEIHSPNWQLRREAERMAVNMPVQGSATGDIIKIAMIKVDEWIKKEKLENDVRLLLQVHDELLFEVNEKMLLPEPVEGVRMIKKIMESAAELKVPLVVDVKAGANWGEQGKI